LLACYREALARRGEALRWRPTFIGSDASAFRSHAKVFTVSTGVVNEHSAEEYVPLAPLGVVVEDVLLTLQLRQERMLIPE
jgi:tripeptide aminopeptidase